MNNNPRRLYRTSDDRMIAGVAGGVAAYFDVDPIIVRVLWFISVIVTGTLSFWAYVIMIFVVPQEPAEWPAQSPWAPGGDPAGYGASYVPPAATGSVPPVDGDAGLAGDAPAAAGPWPDAGSGDPAYGAPNVAGFANVPGQPAAPNAAWTTDWRSQRRQDRWQRRSDRMEARRERGGPGLIFGLLLILVGGLLAWHQVDPSFDVNITWPVVIVAVGLILVVSSIRRDKRD
ncbi:MAG TPA: PspC domain-containing protein [Candidatus Limnocylindrales bacterium]|jgi:phage shock protein C